MPAPLPSLAHPPSEHRPHPVPALLGPSPAIAPTRSECGSHPVPAPLGPGGSRPPELGAGGRRRSRWQASLLALVLWGWGATLPAQTITTQTVDVGTGSSTGQYSSQAIVNGTPAVAYYDVSDGDLMYARNSAPDGSGTWMVVTVDAPEEVGRYCCLTVVNGKPAIAYFASIGTITPLKYVQALDADGTSWGSPITISAVGGVNISLVVVNGKPAIAYGFSEMHYRHATDVDGTSWGPDLMLTASLGGGSVYQSSQVMAVVDGRPAVCYRHLTNGDLHFIRANDADGTTWGAPLTLDSTGDVGGYPSLAVVEGRPAISYYDITNTNLKYVRASDTGGTAWDAPLTLDSSGSVGQFTSLRVVDGNPAIAYYATTNGDLKYLRASDAGGTAWGAPVVVDSAGAVGLQPSLAIVADRPAVTYWSASNSDLKFVRSTVSDGSAWPAAVVVDTGSGTSNVGQFTSAAIVNGNPAVSYTDLGDQWLYYVRATDAVGTGWGTPVKISTVNASGAVATSLAVVAGNPAVSCKLISGFAFIRATDANGTTWNPPVFIDGSSVSSDSSLAVVDGNPAISYYDTVNGDLKFIRASNATGTAWGTPLTVDSIGTVGAYPSLTIVNGNPAISYYDQTNRRPKYVRATDASGTAWGAPVTVDVAQTSGLYTSLEVIDGNPAMSYYKSTGADLAYVRASDANGAAWGTPVTVDSAAAGQYGSLAVVDGRPAISYHDHGNGYLKFARARDAIGAQWGTPLQVDTAGRVGLYTSLLVAGGRAAIGYHDGTNGDLKWATITPAPDIVVSQGSALADGAGVNFGSEGVGAGLGITFTISNAGDAPLTDLAISKEGTDAGDFEVGALSGTSVGVGAAGVSFKVTFRPSAVGSRTAAIHIASNVTTSRNPFDLTLTGTGVDLTPPETMITAGPAPLTNSRTATIEFTGTDNLVVTSFQRSLDGGPFETATSPLNLAALADGPHVLEIRASDAAGNLDATPATLNWTVDATAPTLGLPANIIAEATSATGAAVGYTANASDADGSGVATSSFLPASGSTFPLGTSTVQATATDQAGNTVTGSFTVTVVDTMAPVLSGVPVGGFALEAGATGLAALPSVYAPVLVPGGVMTLSRGLPTGLGKALVKTGPGTIVLPPGGFGSLGQGVIATDAVGVTSRTQVPAPGTMLPLGDHLLTLTALDAAGNSTVVQTTVTVAFDVATPPGEVTVAAQSGTPAPATPGLPTDAVLATFGTPAVSDFRTLAARVGMLSGKKKLEGIYVVDGAGVDSLPAVQGGAAPGPTGAALDGLTFKSFLDPVLSPGGALAFAAMVSGAKAPEDQGVWTDAFGPLALALREGSEVPGLGGARLKSVTSLSLRDGELLALVKLAAAKDLATTADDTVLVRLTGANTGAVLLREGRELSGVPFSRIKTMTVLAPALGSPGQGRWHGDGAVLAKVTLADDRVLLVKIDAAGEVTRMLSTADPAKPVDVRAQWKSFGVPAMGGDGAEFAVAATLTPKLADVTAKDDAVLLFSSDGVAWEAVAREGEPISAATDAPRYLSFFDPVANDSGAVAFLATLQGTGVGGKNKTGLFCGETNHLRVAARLGDPVPDENGTATTAVWSKFLTYALPGGPAGDIVVLAETSGGDTTAKSKLGLWAADSTGQLRRLLRTGDPLTVDGPALSAITLLNATPGTYGAARSYNTTASLAVLATFADKSQAILRVDVP